MEKKLLKQNKVRISNIFLLMLSFSFFTGQLLAQGTWTQLKNNPPHANNSTMMVLSDGRIFCHSGSGSSQGTVWDILKPDSKGSYLNGTWTSSSAMNDDRLYFSSNILKDGRLYVAGGEYGSGKNAAEVYDPVQDIWTAVSGSPGTVSDANSMILENGTVIQALVQGSLTGTKIYNPNTNSYSAGPTCRGAHNESTWVKLKDNSILFIDRNSKNSERYIPQQNAWVQDANVPVNTYDPYGLEAGASFLLPNGDAFFISSLGTNALYTPSGSSSPGTWRAAAVIPNGGGTPDAPAVMLPNGKVLYDASDIPSSGDHFPTPSFFYEYDYLTDANTQISAPGGGQSYASSTYATNMLLMPDGTVLLSENGSSQYYVFTPTDRSQLAAGKPNIAKINVTNNSGVCTYTITGTGFNGISSGSSYGDDVGMDSNFPLVRLTGSDGTVYYARTFNWNSTGVMRGSLPDTAQFELPAGFPTSGTFSLSVVANAIASDPVMFQPCIGIVAHIDEPVIADNTIFVYPNPASENATVNFSVNEEGNYNLKMVDMIGRTILETQGHAIPGLNTHAIDITGIAKGVYTISVTKGSSVYKTKMMVR